MNRAAGWYPDEKMAGTQRYWDGTAWTENVAPISAAPPQPKAPGPYDGMSKGRMIALAIAAVLILFLIVANLGPEGGDFGLSL